MSLVSGVSSFFGLDIGSTAVRVVQLRGNVLMKYGYAPLDVGVSKSDAPADKRRLAKTIKDLIDQVGITTNNVAVGLPSDKAFLTVIDIDKVDNKDLEKSLMYQIDSYIPTPKADSKVDWALLGDSPKGEGKIEVLLSSVPNKYIEDRLELIESIGLNVIAFEPDSIALTRAVSRVDDVQTSVIVDMGGRSTNLIVIKNGAPRLVRSMPTGVESLVKASVQNLNIDENQSQQFLFKFGLDETKLEGQVHNAIVGTVDLLVGEIEKTIKFFKSRYQESDIDKIIVTGGSAAIPSFPLFLANKFGLNVEIGNSWQGVSYPPERQDELLGVSSLFGVSVGLAERLE